MKSSTRRTSRRARDLDRLPVVLGRDDLPRLAAWGHLQRDQDHATGRPAGRRLRRRRLLRLRRRRLLRLRRDLGRDRRRRRRLWRADGRRGLRLGELVRGTVAPGVHDPPRALGLPSSIFAAHARLGRRGAAAHMGKAACGPWHVSSQGETHVRVAPRPVLIDGTPNGSGVCLGRAVSCPHKPAHTLWQGPLVGFSRHAVAGFAT